MLEKTFDPAEAEPRIYDAWESSGAFQPKAEGEGAFCIVIPPPNVTGSLHIGHALNNTLQDVLVRFNRMRGKRVLWQPGTDHAGIATQMVVERQLAQRQEPSRREMGREAFVERVWAWKEESGGLILNQLKRLGASCDWSRERFTMDEGLSEAVLKVFVDLYEQGLIYRDKRLVNWDPKLQTAISDLEVESAEVAGQFWHFKYPLAGGETYEYVERDEDGTVVFQETRDYIAIATTRPETMLGDGAVAVHPTDERYAPIVGKLCEIPVGPKQQRRLIPIITDEYPDRDFGSGAVKITGAHDFNDFAVAKRAGIPMYRLMDKVGALRDDGAPYAEEAEKARALVEAGGEPDPAYVDAINLVPEAYRGLDRFEARKRVVADIDADGLMLQVEDKRIMQPFGDRSGVVIEPMLTDQWYVDAETLAKPAIEAVETGRTRFVPKAWEKTYFEWMRNIQPWCISRQLVWGHRIPAWYGPKLDALTQQIDLGNEAHPTRKIHRNTNSPEVFCALSGEGALEQARAFYQKWVGQFEGWSVDVELYHEKSVDDAISAIKYGIKRPGVLYVDLVQDEDVLDTWFSSALWPFSTLGWPERTDELGAFYPTSVLITAFDIIFFWVARMMMQGLHFMEEIPFHDVYIHALVRDDQGQKMSKSKGNVLDPLDFVDGCTLEALIDKRVAALPDPRDAKRVADATKKQFPNGVERCGADALRFTLVALAAQGRDIRLSPDRILGYRNFGTKVWNAARFAQLNACVRVADWEPASAAQTVNRWIVGEVAKTARTVTVELEAYRFNEAAGAVYRFAWNLYCDWYLELIKPILQGEDGPAKSETQACAAWALDQLLAMLHPFSPFITEELWAKTAGPEGRESMLILAPWPSLPDTLIDEAAGREVSWFIDLVTEIRSVRAEMNVPAGAKAPAVLVGANATTLDWLERWRDQALVLGRLGSIVASDAAPASAIQTVVGEAIVALPIADLIDLDAERARLSKEIAKMDGEIARIDKKLDNPKFVGNAPDAVIEAEKEKKSGYAEQKDRLVKALERLEAVG